MRFDKESPGQLEAVTEDLTRLGIDARRVELKVRGHRRYVAFPLRPMSLVLTSTRNIGRVELYRTKCSRSLFVIFRRKNTSASHAFLVSTMHPLCLVYGDLGILVLIYSRYGDKYATVWDPNPETAV